MQYRVIYIPNPKIGSASPIEVKVRPLPIELTKFIPVGSHILIYLEPICLVNFLHNVAAHWQKQSYIHIHQLT